VLPRGSDHALWCNAGRCLDRRCVSTLAHCRWLGPLTSSAFPRVASPRAGDEVARYIESRSGAGLDQTHRPLRKIARVSAGEARILRGIGRSGVRPARGHVQRRAGHCGR
jgi:hypothetical protein